MAFKIDTDLEVNIGREEDLEEIAMANRQIHDNNTRQTCAAFEAFGSDKIKSFNNLL